ncbi:putative integral membrane protein [Theileria parva strain Muguga]|uniref:Uncharacterized protein n=1 Tax=Theileria parva TaxID=5875 RepID=Q4N3Y9_THEPA|nr:putative integral membrane protein [Theileria parva strain Muguga]EAN33134.1 putative integral membrane protein [Theileria parva strain Muguga]|eukprot:XP_765417.1 hypothetical protein [Theileria parva strain Muguga]
MNCKRYCCLATGLLFATVFLFLFGFTFEGCNHSFATFLSRKLYEYVLDLYNDDTFALFLTLFSYFGQFLANMFFYKGLPSKFYLHCYPLLGDNYLETVLEPLPAGAVMAFKRFVGWFYKLYWTLLKRQFSYFYVFGFFGVMVSVRLLLLSLLLLSLWFAVKYFKHLLKHFRFKMALPLVLFPSYLMVLVVYHLTYESFFTPLHLAASLLLVGTLSYNKFKHSRH